MAKRSLADVIFWIALILLVFWVIAKITGLINTPAIIEAIPYISGIFIAGTIWQQFRNMQGDLVDIKGATTGLLKVENEHNLVMQGKLNVHK